MSTIEDLWPSQINEASEPQPVVVLRQQATLLGNKTNNILEGDVRTTTDGPTLSSVLYVVAPALGGYRFALVTCFHEAIGYPVKVWLHDAEHAKQCDSYFEFTNYLREGLNSQETLRVLGSLLNQSKAA